MAYHFLKSGGVYWGKKKNIKMEVQMNVPVEICIVLIKSVYKSLQRDPTN